MTAKLSLSWLNVILVALLIAAWLGVWAGVERWQSDDDRLREPREDETQLRHGVPTLQGKLAAAQGELAAVQARLLEQHLELAGGDAAGRAVRASYPRLRRLGVPADGGPAPEWLAVRPETIQGFARARAELDVASRLVAALEADHAALTARKADLDGGGADPKGGPRAASLRQSRIAACDEQLDATRKALAQARVDLAKRWAEVEASSASDPRLAGLPADVSPLLDLPPDALATLSAGPARRRAAEAMSRALEAAVGGHRAAVAALTGDLIAAQRRAARDLERRRERWDSRKRWNVLIQAFALSVVLLAVAVPAFWRVSGMTAGRPSRVLTAGAALGSLVVIDVYQAFGAVGGSLAAAVVALAVAVWLVRRVTPGGPAVGTGAS